MNTKKPNTTKKQKAKCQKPKAVLFSDIEDIRMLIIVKGKAHLLISKPGFESQAKVDMETSLRLALDSHIVMDPSIDELEKELRSKIKEITKEK